MRFLLNGRVRFVALLAVTLAAAAAVSAAAAPRGTNGQLTFGRFNPLLQDQQVYVVNPDGVGGARLVQGPNDIGEWQHFSVITEPSDESALAHAIGSSGRST
jgi:hypothetical protein